MIVSKKQALLYNDIISTDIPGLSVLGSTQSGKTHIICAALIEYAQRLNEYEMKMREDPTYVPRDYYGAIVGWTTDTIKGNIVEPIQKILQNEYGFKNGKEYILKFGQNDKYLEIYNIRFYFFGFNIFAVPPYR